MTKLIINRKYGGFGLSIEAEDLYFETKYGHKPFRYKQVEGDWYKRVKNPNDDDWSVITLTKDHGDNLTYDAKKEQGWWYYNDLERYDPILVGVVEQLGKKANGKFASLEVVEIPDTVEYFIDDYDGIETVREQHRTW